jgi:cyclopropane fatty-acyl-phospholipid synthase-like methyltransferase
MKMTAFEKLLVNRSAKSLGNVRQLDTVLASMDISGYRDVLEIGSGTGVVSAHLCADHWMNVTGMILPSRFGCGACCGH